MKVFEINGNTLSLALFIDVTNSKELKESMQAGKLNPEALIPVHSKLVYNYLVSKYITESLKRCGISDDLSYVLAARFNASPVKKLIDGKEIGLEELEGRADQAQILKHYKIFGPELVISTIADAITCCVAARDALQEWSTIIGAALLLCQCCQRYANAKVIMV
ncbi:hypothetical protein ES288_A03G230400v1 [Gossypium darwinii]|uniref:Uncharacterized protein n=1 Tax=Gossypium darwinii TaxID=34276 RepID=A0A5D2H764_GOSDA|nr:hypothetical protein ES288_A03G230400v1 [Gossypium darwinii]